MNLFKKSQSGFTLIELLVVVAIIGILAATILASLGGARAKAQDARKQSELSSLRAAMELYYSSSSTGYTGGFADVSSGARNLTRSIFNSPSADPCPGSPSTPAGFCGASATEWVTAVTLSSKIYCADSNGFAGVVTAMPSSTSLKCQ